MTRPYGPSSPHRRPFAIAPMCFLTTPQTKASALCTHQRIATVFSGIGTPELAMGFLHRACAADGLSFKADVASACESDPDCQRALLKASRGCVFKDLFDRCFTVQGADFDECSLPEKWDRVNRAPVRRKAACKRCDWYTRATFKFRKRELFKFGSCGLFRRMLVILRF